MKRVLSTAALVWAVLVAGARPGNASNPNILFYVDGDNGPTDEMSAALAALSGSYNVTVATSPTNFATLISGGTYNLGIFSAQVAYDATYSAAFAALATFVQGGGKAIVASWFTPLGADIAPFGADYTGKTNGPFMNLTGFNSGVTNPLVALTNPSPPYSTYSDGFTLDLATGVSIAATFFDPGNASGTNGQGAIAIGDHGRSIVNGFMNDTGGAAGKQIYENEISGLLGASTPVPEPGTAVLFAMGGVGLIWLARRRQPVRS